MDAISSVIVPVAASGVLGTVLAAKNQVSSSLAVGYFVISTIARLTLRMLCNHILENSKMDNNTKGKICFITGLLSYLAMSVGAVALGIITPACGALVFTAYSLFLIGKVFSYDRNFAHMYGFVN